MKYPDELMKLVRDEVKGLRQDLRERIKPYEFRTQRMNPEQTLMYMDALAQQYPVQEWIGPDGQLYVGSALFMTLKDDPRVLNGKDVWREFEAAGKRVDDGLRS